MGWEFYCAKSEFHRFAEDWDRLNADLYNSHPYFDSRFISPLLTHFATGKEVLCLLKEEEQISGALILQPRGWGRWSLFQPSQAQITSILLNDARLLLDLFNSLPGFAWIMELPALDLRYAPDFIRQDITSVMTLRAYTVGVQSGTDFTCYWQTRQKKLRSNIQHYSNRIEKEFGTHSLEKIIDSKKMNVGVIHYGVLETAGWKGFEGTAISPDNVQGIFYSEVMRGFAATGQASIYELRIADRLAASRLLVENEEMVVCLKTTYDETLSHVAPGRILLHRVIENILTYQPNQTIEFYTNATQDQRQWATFDYPIRDIGLFKNSRYANAFTFAKTARNILRISNHQATVESHLSPPEIVSFPNVLSIQEAGYDLSDFAPVNNIETSIDWFNLLHNQVFPSDTGVRYYLSRDADQVQVILPLRFIRHGFIKSIKSLGNFYTSLYVPLQSKKFYLICFRDILAKSIQDYCGAHVMRFDPMDPDSPGYHSLMNELRVIGWIPFSFFCFNNWYLKITGDWEDYLKSRTANLRSNIRRRVKKFFEQGGELEIMVGSENIEKTLNEFHEVYSSSWKKPEPYPGFIPSLIHLLASNGMLRLGIARLGGKPIAAQLWIVGHDKASIYKVAYHEKFASLSPGTVLTSHLLRHVIENDHVTEVDFLIGNDDYKRHWMSDCRERKGIIAYNPRTLIGLALLVKELLGRTVKSIGKIFPLSQKASLTSSK